MGKAGENGSGTYFVRWDVSLGLGSCEEDLLIQKVFDGQPEEMMICL